MTSYMQHANICLIQYTYKITHFWLLCFFFSVRSFNVKVDPRGLPHGAHFAEVSFRTSSYFIFITISEQTVVI